MYQQHIFAGGGGEMIHPSNPYPPPLRDDSTPLPLTLLHDEIPFLPAPTRGTTSNGGEVNYNGRLRARDSVSQL